VEESELGMIVSNVTRVEVNEGVLLCTGGWPDDQTKVRWYDTVDGIVPKVVLVIQGEVVEGIADVGVAAAAVVAVFAAAADGNGIEIDMPNVPKGVGSQSMADGVIVVPYYR
jgi:hypothetical protein